MFKIKMFHKELRKTFVAAMVLTLAAWVPGLVLCFTGWSDWLLLMIIGACPLYFGVGVLFADKLLHKAQLKKKKGASNE